MPRPSWNIERRAKKVKVIHTEEEPAWAKVHRIGLREQEMHQLACAQQRMERE